MSEQEKELKRAYVEVDKLRRHVSKLEGQLRDEVLVDPAVCLLKVAILVDSKDPVRDCSRLRCALEGMIDEDMRRQRDGWLMDEGAVRAEVGVIDISKFDIPKG